MLSKKDFVVTIGNYGSLVVLNNNNEIADKLFLDELNDKTKEELKAFFNKSKSAEIFILLDTVDQIYKKKIYPSLSKSDLGRLVKRDLNNDSDKESLKNYLILNPKKTGRNHRWECLFISSSKSEIVNNWIEFLLELPNHLVGIYMLPVESFELFKLLKARLKSEENNPKPTPKKHDVYCMIMQNKVSGIRQVVFSETGIVFTRVVNYDFSQADFLEKYERDIYSSFEYLKRIFPEITLSEFEIINIFSNDILDKIKASSNLELKYHNYIPFQASSEVGYNSLMPQDSQFCDLLFSKIFSKGKKTLKFDTPKISLLSKLFFTLRFSYYTNLILSALILVVFIYTIFSQNKINDLIDTATADKISAFNELNRVKSLTFDGETLTENGKAIEVDTVMDFGKIQTTLDLANIDFIETYSRLSFLPKFNVKLASFDYATNKLDPKNPSANSYKIQITGDIFNKSGDIDDLLKQFDLLIAEAKKTFEKNKIEYTELPRNIDFSQKYYQFPINFTIGNN